MNLGKTSSIPPKLIILLKLSKQSMRASDLMKETGLSESTFFYNLARLQAEGLIRKANGWYEITDKGRLYLEKILKDLKSLLEVVN